MTFVGCTVIQRNFSAHARVLAESFLDRHPGGRFSVLVVDDPEGDLEGVDGCRTLRPADVGVPEEELLRRATMYSAQGLASAHKPELVRHLLREGAGPVVLLDADGCVYADLEPVATLAERHGLVLSPHSLDPHPLRGEYGPEQEILRSGVINGGFLAASGRAVPFLDWWAQRAARHSVLEPERALIYTQSWLTLAAILFDGHVLRDRGCNVMGWNLHERDVEWAGDQALIDGGPLRHFHFCGGFDPEHPERLCAPGGLSGLWPALDERPGAARLCREYAQRLLDAGHRRAGVVAPRYDAMPDGTAIEPWMRGAYRRGLMAAEEATGPEPPNPFAHGSAAFLGWLADEGCRPASRAPQNADDRSSEPAFEAALAAERAARLRVESEARVMHAELGRIWAELDEERARMADQVALAERLRAQLETGT